MIRTFIGLVVLSSLLGCNDDNKVKEPDVETNLASEVRTLIEPYQLKGLSQHVAELPHIEQPIAQLGMQLFYAKSLSGNMDTACASCHHPFLGGGDDLALPIGVDAIDPELLGPGREHLPSAEHADGGPTVPRNAPSTFNIAFYNKEMFHDGRVESLSDDTTLNGVGQDIRTPDSLFNTVDTFAGNNLSAAQARFPVTSKEEMRGFSFAVGLTNQQLRDQLASRLQGKTNELSSNGWFDAFLTGFETSADTTSLEELITYDNIAFALGEFQRSQVLINSPWHKFVEGDDNALTEQQLVGAKLFYTSYENGGFNCASCHSGDFMTDESFHVIAMPQIGRGKGDGVNGDEDFGRFRETKTDSDRFAFRTPHLTNIEVTFPYGHSGAFATLEEVVKHHLNPAVSIANYDPSTLQPGLQTENWLANTEKALNQLTQLQNAGTAKLKTVEYTDQQVDAVVAFLKAQTDPCVKDEQCLMKWIPTTEQDVDNTQLVAEFN
ncbi:cytochrome-c peroxidase [Pseudoalteromonas sp. G4]|uniref:cytochrome-c peroxidase n=1 Tax=Pseudoalteromonas sp. G4 TaxID=2992761 RepID=UPI00237E2861|nr:cytochrome c peroxidase [Pseudoalteromonas sp. G4]MDE3270529.1 cytochrome-c peroxidase [Pseudoalteromonas sp. G4]